MAGEAVLDIVIRARDQASGTLKSVSSSFGAFGQKLGPVTQGLGRFSSGLNQAIIPLGAATIATRRFTDAALEDERSVVRLQQATQAAGLGWDKYGKQLEDTAKKGMHLGFTDEQVRDSLSLLIAGTGSAEEAMKRLAIAQDVSRGTGIELSTTTRLLTKITDESVNVFSRYGIRLQEGMDTQQALAEVQKRFAGQADAYAKSNAGAMERQRIKIDEMEESLGRKLVPVLTTVIGLFNALPAPVQTGVIAFAGIAAIGGPMASALSGLGSALISLGPVMVQAGRQAVAMAATMNAALLTPPVGVIVAIIAALALLAAAFYFNWFDIRGKTMAVFTAIKDFLTNNWQDILKIALIILAGPAGLVYLFVSNSFGIRDRVLGIFGELKDRLMGLLDGFLGWLRDHWVIILGTILGGPAILIIYLFHDQIKGAIDQIISLFAGLPGRIVDALGDLGSILFDAGKDLIQGFIDGMKSIPIPNPLDLVPGGGLLDKIPGASHIPGLQHGGIITRPTLALIGERGPEAVIPLERGIAATPTPAITNQFTFHITADPGWNYEQMQKMARILRGEFERETIGATFGGAFATVSARAVY